MPSWLLYPLLVLALAGYVLGVAGWLLARRWARDCAEARILIAVKGKVKLDAPLVEWLAWNKALPKRERGRGGVIFHQNGVSIALARPKVMANTGAEKAKAETRTIKTEPAGPPPANRSARRAAARTAS